MEARLAAGVPGRQLAACGVSVYEYRARLAGTAKAGVVDGDTLDVVIDLGFGITREERVRVEGVNAPEMATPDGPPARRWVLDWMTAHGAERGGVGWSLVLRTSKPDPRDKYGRYVARVVAGNGDDLTADMLAAGIAQPYP
mgnify:FL=1